MSGVVTKLPMNPALARNETPMTTRALWARSTCNGSSGCGTRLSIITRAASENGKTANDAMTIGVDPATVSWLMPRVNVSVVKARVNAPP